MHRAEELGGLKQDWEELAALDPWWAVLTLPDRSNNRWDLDEFWESGSEQANATVERITNLGATNFETVLDFGCGVGRLTKGLAAHYADALGVDISEQMITIASEHHHEPGLRFEALGVDGLGAFPQGGFDLVHTMLVLQHFPKPATILHQLDEFVPLLRDGGFLVFDVPIQTSTLARLQLRRRVYRLLRALRFAPRTLVRIGLNPMVMTEVSGDRMQRWIDDSGLELCLIDDRETSGLTKRFYYLRKNAG